MKEVMAIVRPQKVNATKVALADAGYPSFTCHAVLGRGKNHVDLSVLGALLENGEIGSGVFGESLTESARLISKRLFTLIVEDEDVSGVVKVVTEVNKTGNPGDGRIFVLPIGESYRIRNGEAAADAY